MHKFIVLLEGERPVEVLTGSTNDTEERAVRTTQLCTHRCSGYCRFVGERHRGFAPLGPSLEFGRR